MADPIKPVKIVKIGGVSFNQNEIQKSETLKENGATRYSVFLKNGVQVKYPAQKDSNDSSISVDKFNRTKINNLAFGKVKGSDNFDDIRLNGNNGTTVDVSGGGADLVTIHDTLKYNEYGPEKKEATHSKFSKNNTVITDEDDRINIYTENTNLRLEGEGITDEASLKGMKQE